MCWQWKCTITAHCTPVSEVSEVLWAPSEQWVAALLPATGGAAQSNGWQLSCQLQVGLLRAMGGSSPASYRWGCSGFCGVVALTLQWLPLQYHLVLPPHSPLTPHHRTHPSPLTSALTPHPSAVLLPIPASACSSGPSGTACRQSAVRFSTIHALPLWTEPP